MKLEDILNKTQKVVLSAGISALFGLIGCVSSETDTQKSICTLSELKKQSKPFDYMHSKELEACYAEVEAKVLKDPDDTAVFWMVGYLENHDRYETIIEILSRYIEYNSHNAFAYELRGKAYRNLNKLDEALKDYDTAHYLRPEKGYNLYRVAQIKELLGRYDEAIEDYEELLECTEFNDTAEAQKHLAACKKKLKK